MSPERLLPLVGWIASAGLSGLRELELLQGFCERAVAAGLPLGRAMMGIDTLHPVLVGRVFEWNRDAEGPTQAEYERLNFQNTEEMWRQSPFHQLYESGGGTLRRRLDGMQPGFPMLEELRHRGMTDYLAVVTRFGTDGAIGLMDCTYSSWASDRASGFSDDDLAGHRQVSGFRVALGRPSG